MRKTQKVIYGIIFLMASIVNAQDNSAISLLGGYTQEGFAGLGTYNYYTNQTDFVSASVLATFAKDKVDDNIEIPYNIYSLNIGYFKKILQTRNNNITLSIGGGGVIGYESINNGEQQLDTGALLVSESGLIYGAFAGLDTDIFVNENMSFVIKANQYYHFGSDLGNLTLFAGAGFRFFL